MRPPEDWRRARVTLVIAAITLAAFLLIGLASAGERALNWGGFFPYRFSQDTYGSGAPVWLTPLTATLLHGGFAHILSNLLILLVCGRSTENVLGPAAIVILYVTGAFAAAAGHYVLDPRSVNAMIGASGAVSAVLGAYAMLFGRNKVKVKNPTLALWLNALWLIVGWIVLQLVIGILSRRVDLNIAIGAHIGGFLIGLALVKPLLILRYRNA